MKLITYRQLFIRTHHLVFTLAERKALERAQEILERASELLNEKYPGIEYGECDSITEQLDSSIVFAYAGIQDVLYRHSPEPGCRTDNQVEEVVPDFAAIVRDAKA